MGSQPPEAKRDAWSPSFSSTYGEHGPANTLISDFWPPELGDISVFLSHSVGRPFALQALAQIEHHVIYTFSLKNSISILFKFQQGCL